MDLPTVFSNAELEEQSQGFPDRLWIPVRDERARETHYATEDDASMITTRREQRWLSCAMTLLPLSSGDMTQLHATVLAAEAMKMRASLWTYETLCDFPDPPNWPTKESRKAGTSLSAEECSALGTKLGRPVAVRLTIENAGATESEIPIDGLGSVKVQTTAGKAVSAVAVRRKNVGGPKYYFTTEISGTWIVHVAPGRAVDLVFLFPEAKRGSQLTLATVGSVKIE